MITTVSELTAAIRNSVDSDERELMEEEAYDLAIRVLSFFGYSDRIIDNVLEPQDRDAFYMLEDAEILTTEREETTLYDGREWRIHYWLFRRDRIDRLINKVQEHEQKMNLDEFDYGDLPDDIWKRGSE